MAEILLTSETFVRSTTNVSDNISGKYLLPSIREAQEQGLRGILGDALLASLKDKVKDNTLEQFQVHKQLVDRCQYYLAYLTLVELSYKVSYKIGNFGVAKGNDENLQVASFEEIVKMQDYYQSKVDACCIDLQNWLLEHRKALPELNDNQCHKIQSNLYSAATCGVWLGGPRGKMKRR